MGKVFLSFSSQDDPLATFVASELASDGISVFKAPSSIAPGEGGREPSPRIFATVSGS
jgi:hypothetical protein